MAKDPRGDALYKQVYDEFMEKSKDPAWMMGMEIALGEWMQDIAVYHQAYIQIIADKAAQKQISRAKGFIAKSYLDEKLAEIRKDEQSPGRRWEKEKNWQRNQSGQFSRYVGPKKYIKPRPTHNEAGQAMNYGSKAQNYDQVVRDHFGRMTPNQRKQSATINGLLARPNFMPPEPNQGDHAADVHRNFAVMTNELESRTGDAKDKQRVQFMISHPDGHTRVVTPLAGAMPHIAYDEGERVQFMTPVGPDNPVHIGGRAMNLGLLAGASDEQAAKAGSVTQDIRSALNSTTWGERMVHTANVMRTVSDDNPTTVQAHAFASFVNLLGPDAARAFGPKLRQLSYRYSGMEAAPDQMSDVAKGGRLRTRDSLESIGSFESRLVEDLAASSVPTETQFKLSMQSGSTPPSKGYLLDKNGKVVSEAVGFADDWYTPFNLSKMGKLKDGSYVRSRSVGGITPEDLRTAMHTGAKRVTVVSRSGVFTQELDPRAMHWGHRFGFGGAAMVRRYTKTLDAIKNNKVNSPDEPEHKLQLDAQGYQVALADLRMKYPYYLRPAKFNEKQFALGSGGSSDGSKLDTSYIRPLSIRPADVQGGFTGATTHILGEKPIGGTFAYDQLETYRHNQSLLLGITRNVAAVQAATEEKKNGTSTLNVVNPLSWTEQQDHKRLLNDRINGRRLTEYDNNRLNRFSNQLRVARDRAQQRADQAAKATTVGPIALGRSGPTVVQQEAANRNENDLKDIIKGIGLLMSGTPNDSQLRRDEEWNEIHTAVNMTEGDPEFQGLVDKLSDPSESRFVLNRLHAWYLSEDSNDKDDTNNVLPDLVSIHNNYINRISGLEDPTAGTGTITTSNDHHADYEGHDSDFLTKKQVQSSSFYQRTMKRIESQKTHATRNGDEVGVKVANREAAKLGFMTNVLDTVANSSDGWKHSNYLNVNSNANAPATSAEIDNFHQAVFLSLLHDKQVEAGVAEPIEVDTGERATVKEEDNLSITIPPGNIVVEAETFAMHIVDDIDDNTPGATGSDEKLNAVARKTQLTAAAFHRSAAQADRNGETQRAKKLTDIANFLIGMSDSA